MKGKSRLVVPALCVAAPLGLLSCNEPSFRAVSIRPIYGWVDGCTPVSIGGSGFGDDVSVTIGGKALVNPELPPAPDDDDDNDYLADDDPSNDADDEEVLSRDYGYQVTGLTPPGDAAGYATVTVSTGGQSADIFEPFYYEACPLAAYPESISPDTGLASGTTVALSGCNLSSDYQVQVGTANPVAITSTCSTASVTFTAPDLPAGDYYVAIVDSAGNLVFPDAASGCDTTGAVGASVTGSDTAAVDPCDGVPVVTYGGGE